jgi:hypothetical protein
MLNTVYNKFMYCISLVTSQNLSREHWIAVSVVVLGMGLYFMRGFGSRKNY